MSYGVHVACNDADNGSFIGKAQAISLDFGHGDHLELDMVGAREPRFGVDIYRTRFRLGRLWYPFERSRDWVGNWCWNAYYMHGQHACRLVSDLMADKRWACTAGPVDASDAFDAKDNGAFMRAWHACLWPPKTIADEQHVPPEAPKEQD